MRPLHQEWLRSQLQSSGDLILSERWRPRVCTPENREQVRGERPWAWVCRLHVRCAVPILLY